MNGINLNKPIKYLHASLRYFGEKEYHISRICENDVLLLVFEGCLRFTEDGIPYEINAGEYFIQHNGGVQKGETPSDAPKYLYVHFEAEWSNDPCALARRGTFSYSSLKATIEEMDSISHGDYLVIEKIAKFYELLSVLYHKEEAHTISSEIASYLKNNFSQRITLDMLSERFHFSKNHIIKLFTKNYGTTPVVYLDLIRIKNAEYMLESSSLSCDEISARCGYGNYSHFYRQFKRKNGASPEEWRKEKRTGDFCG